MKNQVIKNLNPEMGKEIIKYFQSLGVDTLGLTGDDSEEDFSPFIYYGLIDGVFGNYGIDYVEKNKAEIIELPTENKLPKRGDRILVWDSDEKSNKDRIFVTFIENAMFPVITVDINHEDRFLNNEPFDTITWTNWKPIIEEAETIVELTLEDISNGKGVGVKPELIRIKK